MPKNYLSRQRQAEIVEKIDEVRSQFGFYPETSLTSIIEGAIPGVSIKEDSFNGDKHTRGVLFRKKGQFKNNIIAIQSDQSKRDKTFALAHEFAHFQLNHNPEANYFIDNREFDGSNGMQDEGEANFFAMELLMPKAVFEKVDLPYITDDEIADYFGVARSKIWARRKWLQGNGY
jgi:Zn-dependent peptidase ImmA (M78 family)